MARPLPLETIPIFSKSHLPNCDFDYGSAAIMLVYKEQGWTSFDAVRFIRSRLKTKKVGHAGTLDPMATGLLVICSGRATKSISQIQEMAKTYVAEITFGGSTVTYDAEAEINQTAPFEHISEDIIRAKLSAEFSGEIGQVPPMYSALKRGGKKLYELARKGEKVKLYPRPVNIYSTKILSYKAPVLKLEVVCSKGTYIRSIAHDLGLSLDSRAHLSALERTSIGEYSSSAALTPHQIDDYLNKDG